MDFPSERFFKFILVLKFVSFSSGPAAAFQNDDDNYLILQILHLNDFHARFEPINWHSGACGSRDKSCVGGIARIATKSQEMRNENPNVLFLNAGDTFAGTEYYDSYGWNITVQFMNLLNFDAITLGNHEFDSGIKGVVPYLQRLNAPVIVCNIDASEEQEFQLLIKPSVIIQRNGHEIGIIGVIAKDTPLMSKDSGKLKFEDEVASVKREASELKQQGINIVIVLSHSGLNTDKAMAAEIEEIDIIVGGHSHSLLYKDTPPGGDVAVDDYPVVITQKNGHKVAIVQAGAFSKYLGNLTVTLDRNGELVSADGNPILLSTSVKQDENFLRALEPWKQSLVDHGNFQVGSTKVLLDSSNYACFTGECNIGNLITDAMVHEYAGQGRKGSWTAASVAFMNAEGIRSSIVETNEGSITYRDVVISQPFGNTFDLMDFTGGDLLSVLEASISKERANRLSNNFSSFDQLQVSGIKVTYNLNKPVGQRVTTAAVRCADCSIPQFEPIKANHLYTAVVPSYLAGGGNTYDVFPKKGKNHRKGRKDIEVVIDYMKSKGVIMHGIEGRITIIQKDDVR